MSQPTHAPAGQVIGLDQPTAADPMIAGAKAARLATLIAAGFSVPAGVVVPTAVVAGADDDALRATAAAALDQMGAGPVAVRSSAIAEDRADASFAGLYDSVLEVEGVDAVAEAIAQVRASAQSDRVAGYAGASSDGGIAVLIQRMVPAIAAGVAFTANPVTGDRQQVAITAVTGLGDRLVSGEAAGETWTVRTSDATCDQPAPTALDEHTARAVADLARQVEAQAGSPQDIEWAIDDEGVWLLQARPMTALAPQVSWDPPEKGWWRRDFRFGEWLPEPVTPLFDTWFFPRQEAGFAQCTKREFGVAVEGPFHVLVNGWCYCNVGKQGPKMLLVIARHPIMMGKWMAAFATIGKKPALGERVMAKPAWQMYVDRLLPGYLAAIATAEAAVEAADPSGLVAIVDDVSTAFGDLTYPMVETLGYAGKAEFALAGLYHRELAPKIGGSHLTLLAGLVQPKAPAPHSVTTLDWRRPVAGELPERSVAIDPARFERLVADRKAAEAACRAALADEPKQLARFDEFLDIAQRYAVIREQMADDLTLGWPVLRRALLRLGDVLIEAGAIAQTDDLFFLRHDEVLTALGASNPAPMAAVAEERRATWTEQKRLVPPAAVGAKAHIAERIAAAQEQLRTSAVEASERVLVGMPASAGTATGPARIVRGPDDFAKVQPGDVLVAPVTAPAWTPLFASVAAVVTDTGSVAAHASVIAREYAIPAVVGTGDATSRLRDGMLVTVDGGRGSVSIGG